MTTRIVMMMTMKTTTRSLKPTLLERYLIHHAFRHTRIQRPHLQRRHTIKNISNWIIMEIVEQKMLNEIGVAVGEMSLRFRYVARNS